MADFLMPEDPAVLNFRARMEKIHADALVRNQLRGSRLRVLREQFNLSRQDAGKAIGVNTSSLSRAENGYSRQPMDWVFERAAKFFGVDRGWFESADSPPPKCLPNTVPEPGSNVPHGRPAWKGKAKRAQLAQASPAHLSLHSLY